MILKESQWLTCEHPERMTIGDPGTSFSASVECIRCFIVSVAEAKLNPDLPIYTGSLFRERTGLHAEILSTRTIVAALAEYWRNEPAAVHCLREIESWEPV